MTISILQQIIELLTTNFVDKLTDPRSLIRRSDKRFWQGYFFGQIVFFIALLIVLQIIVKF